VRRAGRIGTACVLGISALSVAVGLSGCVATAAVVTTVVVVRMLTPYGYKLTVKAEEEPRELYNGLVALLKRSHPNIKVLTENQPERAFDAKWTREDGVEEWVSLVVQPLPDETSELVIALGFGKKQKAAYKEWATERVGEMMSELGVEWKIAAGVMPREDHATRLARATRNEGIAFEP
jgi:hypothetical protein